MTEDALTWFIIYKSLCKQRYLYYCLSISKSNWANTVLPNSSKDQFCKILYIDRLSFKYIMSFIKDNPILYNNSNILQTLIHMQLHYALYKFGSDRNASSWTSRASKWWISKRYMYDCTLQVIVTLINLKNQLIIWPNHDKKKIESMKNNDRERFLGAVGKLDGINIMLKLKPGGIFKKRNFFQLKKILCPGLMRRLWFLKKIDIYPCMLVKFAIWCLNFCFYFYSSQSKTLFLPGKYLLPDAAYSNTSYLIRPYKSPYTRNKSNWRFNQKLFNIYIDMEHVFKMLKGWWESLTGLRLMIWSKEKYKLVVKWITACCILYNIFDDMKANWGREEGWWTKKEISRHNKK